MSSYNVEYNLRCWNDCEMGGCPTHSIKIEANNTSNSLTYTKDSEFKFGMDFDELIAFVKEVYNMRHWVEIDTLFRELDNKGEDNV